MHSKSVSPALTSVSPVTRQIADSIAKCCADQNITPADLGWGQFKRWLKDTLGLEASDLRDIETHVRSVGGFNTLRNAFFAAAPTASQVEQTEIKGLAKLGRVANSALANHELFEQRVEALFTKMLRENAVFKPFGYSFKQQGKNPWQEKRRVLNLALSDLHFGTALDKREVPYEYGFKEESRRLASIVKRVCEFKRDYRNETELVVWLGGDIIKGIIHDMVAGLCLADQVADSVWLLRQALIVLAGEFKKVTVYCSSGNHDRNVVRHIERATSGKYDSYATHVYVGVKAGVAHLPNIQVVIPRTPFIEYHPFPHQRVYATHGDTNLNPGNPGKNIDVGKLEAQMLRINSGEHSRNEKPFGLFVVGHVHIGSLCHPAPGDLITNGCLIPPDPYAVSINYTSVKNGQYLWETTPHRLVGDSRFLEVDESVDRDADLDKLIIPWSGDY